MKLQRIEQTASQVGRVRLVFEDGTKKMVYPSVVADLCLYPGKELNQPDMEQLEQTIGVASARNRAVRMITASDVSKKDLQRRLIAKGETPEHAKDAVQWLDDMELLDDRRTARQIVRQGVQKGYGRARIRQMLYAKQIPRELWDEVLADVPDMSDAIDDFIQRRLGRGAVDEKTVKKTVDALLRRGHSYGEIKAALERFESSIDEILEDESL